jgi:hypothetical protein
MDHLFVTGASAARKQRWWSLPADLGVKGLTFASEEIEARQPEA